ncbi:hypothetical protein ACIBEJ_43830 [Nonomuraea sp. NPDC050790]|uniref:hypothetical protein n=1 Tax=Nonomuraea sp. NPDC050790 TaxID=3364371 RepID=UPI0037AEB160
MNEYDARSALDDIRRGQDSTRQEIARQATAGPYVLLAALGLFAAFAGIDLPSPWNLVALVLGLGLYAATGIVREHRATARRKPAGADYLLHAGWFAGLVLVFSAGRVAAHGLLGLPAQGLWSQATVGAAAVAVVYLATTPLLRRAILAIMRRNR